MQKDILLGPTTDQTPLGLQWESVAPIFADPMLLNSPYAGHLGIEGIISPFKYEIRRLSQFDERWYSYWNDTEKQLYYAMSVTTFTHKSMGISPYLLNYLMDMGKEASDIHKKWAAEYGTFFHIEAGNFFASGEYDFGPNGWLAEDRLSAYMLQSIGESDYKKLKGYFLRRFYKDMAAVIQFAAEKKVQPIGVEFPIISYKWPLASVIDLVCRLEFGGKMVNAIVDFKTGQNFFEEHQLQLALYKELWNEHFGDIFPITHIFNWRPKDFREDKTPTYELKNQTDHSLDFEGRLMVGFNEGWFDKTPSQKLIMSGVSLLGNAPQPQLIDPTKTALENATKKQ